MVENLRSNETRNSFEGRELRSMTDFVDVAVIYGLVRRNPDEEILTGLSGDELARRNDSFRQRATAELFEIAANPNDKNRMDMVLDKVMGKGSSKNIFNKIGSSFVKLPLAPVHKKVLAASGLVSRFRDMLGNPGNYGDFHLTEDEIKIAQRVGLFDSNGDPSAALNRVKPLKTEPKAAAPKKETYEDPESIKALREEQKALKTKISQGEARVASIETRLAAIEDNIKVLESSLGNDDQIEQLKKEKADLETKKKAIDDRLASDRGRLDSASTYLQLYDSVGNTEELDKKIKDARKVDVGVIDGQIEQLEQQLEPFTVGGNSQQKIKEAYDKKKHEMEILESSHLSSPIPDYFEQKHALERYMEILTLRSQVLSGRNQGGESARRLNLLKSISGVQLDMSGQSRRSENLDIGYAEEGFELLTPEQAETKLRELKAQKKLTELTTGKIDQLSGADTVVQQRQKMQQSLGVYLRGMESLDGPYGYSREQITQLFDRVKADADIDSSALATSTFLPKTSSSDFADLIYKTYSAPSLDKNPEKTYDYDATIASIINDITELRKRKSDLSKLIAAAHVTDKYQDIINAMSNKITSLDNLVKYLEKRRGYTPAETTADAFSMSDLRKAVEEKQKQRVKARSKKIAAVDRYRAGRVVPEKGKAMHELVLDSMVAGDSLPEEDSEAIRTVVEGLDAIPDRKAEDIIGETINEVLNMYPNLPDGEKAKLTELMQRAGAELLGKADPKDIKDQTLTFGAGMIFRIMLSMLALATETAEVTAGKGTQLSKAMRSLIETEEEGSYEKMAYLYALKASQDKNKNDYVAKPGQPDFGEMMRVFKDKLQTAIAKK